MRYLVKGIHIHSDRAAIPSGRKSTRLQKFLARIEPSRAGLDYGCGKLRHIDEQLQRFHRLTVVDSEIQLTKPQLIHGRETTVEAYCRRYRGRVKSYRLTDTHRIRRKHDWAFLINVLSAIPDRGARVAALRTIHSLLRNRGQLLVVSQYTNSKFAAFEVGQRHLDGHIYKSRRGHHFFGRISLRVLKGYLRESGFSVEKITPTNGYFYITAEKNGAAGGIAGSSRRSKKAPGRYSDKTRVV